MELKNLQIDALADSVYFDPQVKRYRYKGGSPGEPIKGTFISRAEVLKLQESFLSKITKEFIGMAPKLIAGEIGSYKDAAVLLKKIHMSNAIIKSGGIDKITNSQLGTIGNILKKQYYSGKNEVTGKSYGLKHLIKEAQETGMSESMMSHRLNLYAKNGALSGEIIKRENANAEGCTEMKRNLGKTHQHCDDCIRYAGAGWVGINQLPLPKTACQCRSNCVCSVEYR